MLVVGVVPIWQYADAATVPNGASASVQQAEVLRVVRTGRYRAGSQGGRGRTAVVRLADDSEEGVYLAPRIGFPDHGDTLTVYREDGDWHTTSERSRLEPVGGVVVLVLVPLLTGSYLLSRRRRDAGR